MSEELIKALDYLADMWKSKLELKGEKVTEQGPVGLYQIDNLFEYIIDEQDRVSKCVERSNSSNESGPV
jgi:hypothetical protein